jgi:hypothetical protein
VQSPEFKTPVSHKIIMIVIINRLSWPCLGTVPTSPTDYLILPLVRLRKRGGEEEECTNIFFSISKKAKVVLKGRGRLGRRENSFLLQLPTDHLCSSFYFKFPGKRPDWSRFWPSFLSAQNLHKTPTHRSSTSLPFRSTCYYPVHLFVCCLLPDH